MPGVGKNNPAQIDRWCGGVDRPAEAFLDQAGNPAAMIEMSVGEDDRVNPIGRDRHVMPVALAPLFRALKHAAVDENQQPALSRRIAGIDEMFRAGDRSRSAKKLDVCQAPSSAEVDSLCVLSVLC